MRTTIDIEDDVLQAAKELASQEHSTAGRIISGLARRGLNGSTVRSESTIIYKDGLPVLASRGEVITMEHIQKLMVEEGI